MKNIQSTVLSKIPKTDKNNQNYLILELENNESIFVFANQINPDRWDDFQIGQTCQFTVKIGISNINILVDYKALAPLIQAVRIRLTTLKGGIDDVALKNKVNEAPGTIPDDKNWTQQLEAVTSFQQLEDYTGKVEAAIAMIHYLNWTDIHKNFKYYRRNWEEHNFDHQTAKEWKDFLEESFAVRDFAFYSWLRDEEQLIPQENKPFKQQGDLERLREKYNKLWIDAHPDFNKKDPLGKISQQLWEESGLTCQDAREWATVGFKPSESCLVKKWKSLSFTFWEAKQLTNNGVRLLDDYEFVKWLRNVKGCSLEWITAYQSDYQILSERFKKFGLCSECNQPNTGENWCKECNANRFKNNFPNWTSKNQEIDKFIQKYQLEATDKDKFLEWIPYGEFSDIEYLAQGGFGKVYKAKWMAGNIHHWDNKNKRWYREKDHHYIDRDAQPEWWNRKYKNHREVVLKSLTNSQNNTEFLEEAAKHKIIDDWFNNIVPCYGLSRDYNENYIMVMKYMPQGNLRNYLNNEGRESTLESKFRNLTKIAQGLKDIHSKNLVHRDFHSGNILKGIKRTDCLITDLGLCKPADELSKEDQIFGVMPYVAPEVLRSQPYTQAADIYSFGIIAYEVFSGLPPYYDVEHDLQLALAICQGQRPQFQIKIPQLLEDLIKRCWDTDPNQRPTTSELERTLRKWEQGSTQFQIQLQEAEKYNQTLPDEIKYPDYKKKMHTGAIYHSRLLPTGEISQILSQSQSSQFFEQATSEQVYLEENTSDLDSFAINLETEQQAQIIHNPPKSN